MNKEFTEREMMDFHQLGMEYHPLNSDYNTYIALYRTEFNRSPTHYEVLEWWKEKTNHQ